MLLLCQTTSQTNLTHKTTRYGSIHCAGCSKLDRRVSNENTLGRSFYPRYPLILGWNPIANISVFVIRNGPEVVDSGIRRIVFCDV